MNKNGNFKSTVGFVLACIGSAVGMGNIWMFPYRLGQYGGAAFLIPYLIFIALFGLVGLSAEFALGRMAKTGTLGAYAYCWKNKFGKYIGWLPLLGSLGIAIGYSVILGWVFRSIQGVLTSELLTNDIPAFFNLLSLPFVSAYLMVPLKDINFYLFLNGNIYSTKKHGSWLWDKRFSPYPLPVLE